MSLQPYYYDPFLSFFDVNRLLDDACCVCEPPRRGARRVAGPVERTSFMPKIDVHENAEANLVTTTFELPGLKKEDVKIDLQNSRLSVSGEMNTSDEKTEKGYVVKERRSGKFFRTIPLASGTKPEEIKASMENGVLTVTFPKTTAEETAKKITIS